MAGLPVCSAPERACPAAHVLPCRSRAGTLRLVASRDHLERLYPEVRAYARALARDRSAADDLVGDAMVRALARPGVPEDEARLRPWLLRTIRNLHVDHWRALRVRRDYAGAMAHASGEADGPRAEDDTLGRRAFARLTPSHREVLVLIDVLGHSYAEAALLLGVPRGTIMSRVARARAAMVSEVHGVALPRPGAPIETGLGGND